VLTKFFHLVVMKNLSSQEHKAKTSVQPEMLLNHSESFLEPLCAVLEGKEDCDDEKARGSGNRFQVALRWPSEYHLCCSAWLNC
jgi:hypothetical protein